MIHDNEVIMLLIGLGCLFFISSNNAKLRQVKDWKLITAGFLLMMCAWFATILEGLIWPDALNIIEHVCYTAGAIVTAIWFWRVFIRDGKANV